MVALTTFLERSGRCRVGLRYHRCVVGLRILELISVLRNAQLSSPGAFPDSRHEGEGIRLAAQTCLRGTWRPGAGHPEARCWPVSLLPRICDDARFLELC